MTSPFAISPELSSQLTLLRSELEMEANDILHYWLEYVQDPRGGFYGAVDYLNKPDLSAPKGLVMQARICWAFAKAINETGNKQWLWMATRAVDYICNHFTDHSAGGFYWSVDANGDMLDSKKQVYGLAFVIYAFSEYYIATGQESILSIAKELYRLIEQHSYDNDRGGYIEAFTRDWQPITDLRLSAKDSNERKTANTHLHIIEAYANLYRAWPDPLLKQRIHNLLDLFVQYFTKNNDGHLALFFDDDWELKSRLRSYGHDIEAAWLLLQCATGSDYPGKDTIIGLSLQLTRAAIRGLDDDGGLWYEYDAATDHLIAEKHSWPQAEAIIGFINAWELSGETSFAESAIKSWDFIKKHIRDSKGGEWFWGVHADYSVMQKDKAGFWKCPYHNTRAAFEIMKRVAKWGKRQK